MNQNFQLLKILACVSVCLSHYLQIKELLLNPGVIGICIFFFISGFLIMKSLERHTFQSFFTHRFFRIYPVFLIVSLAAILLHSAGKSTIIAQIFMANDLFGKNNLIAVQWTLLIEIKFYLFAGLAFYFCRENFLKVFYSLSFSLFIILALVGRFQIATTTLGGLLVIAMGMNYYLNKNWILIFSNALGAAVLLGGSEAIFSIIAIAAALLICLIILEIKLPQRSEINFLADLVYPVYLLHYTFDMPVVFMLLLAWILSRFIEKPGIEFCKKKQEQIMKLRKWLTVKIAILRNYLII